MASVTARRRVVERAALLCDDQPDDARDECIRLVQEPLEFGAEGFDMADDIPVVKRIIPECAAMARVPQLLNEAVLGVAIA
jgi:hypothetical protein